ncbi:glycosyltransferase family 2 protein [Pseudonocardia sp. WMMC193]|uniref:glycosyltransferase family 2 protein n=1 Tax=Pseudonocardia sp. WMMC193 TaxID=2911965 RepID=UPI001F17656F|nr:glycosyltransferase family 2 protein [Pseudonocardia sp. WMMC193]MCF7553815.1 glycosyltransferase [Pseudonocardia sp. WMMC193]
MTLLPGAPEPDLSAEIERALAGIPVPREPEAVPPARRPAKVLVVDVEAGAPDLEALVPHYQQAWVLLRRGGRPLRLVEVDLAPDRMGAREEFRTLVSDLAAIPVPRREWPLALPSVSVVIPTVGTRVDELADCLRALSASHRGNLAGFEIIVVDNRPPHLVDATVRAVCARFPLVKTVRQPIVGISAARNAGVRAATGDIVAFTDDDVQVDPGWVAAIADRFARNPGFDAVTGLVMPAELETDPQVWFERYYGGFASERILAPVSYRIDSTGPSWTRSTVVARSEAAEEVRRFALYGAGACGAGCNMAFRRATLLEHPFDEALGTGTPARGGEDLAALIGVLWRGAAIGYEPAALVHHRHREHYTELRSQMVAYGTGFVATIAGLLAHDPRHGLALGVQLPKALARFTASTAVRLSGRRPEPGMVSLSSADRIASYPPELTRDELGGYLRGLPAYVRSRRRARRIGV